MRFGEQARVLRLIPGLENAEFLRFGQIHRNTYINAPALLNATLQLRTRPEHLLRRTDFRRRRLRRIHRHRTHGRPARRRSRARRSPAPLAARNRARLALPLHLRRRPEALSARQHHLRPPPPARRGHAPAAAPRQESAPRRSLPARARQPSTSIAMPMSELERQIARYLAELVARRQLRPHYPRLRRRPAPVPRLPLAARTRAARARRHRPADCCASGSPRSTATSSPPSPSAANSPPSAACSASCSAKASSRSTSRGWCARPKRPRSCPK